MDKVTVERKAPNFVDPMVRTDFHDRIASISDEFALLFRMKDKLTQLFESIEQDAPVGERDTGCSLTIFGETYNMTLREAGALLHELEGMRRSLLIERRTDLTEDMDAAVKADFVDEIRAKAREAAMLAPRVVRASTTVRPSARPSDETVARDFEAVLGSEIAGLTERGAAR